MKYTGDTPSKKVARLIVWKRMKEILGARFLTGRHLVLLSSEAGDISTLLGLGVQPSHILGVDLDKHAVAAAKHKFKDVPCYTGHVEDIAKLHRHNIVSAYLDFCGPMRNDNLETVTQVARYLGKHAAMAAAFKMGREKGMLADAVNAAKKRAAPGSAVFYSRAELLTSELLKRGKDWPQWLISTDFYRYSSLKATEEKSEMLVCVGQLGTSNRQVPKGLVSEICRSAFYSNITVDERAIGPLASLLASHDEDAHLLLNLKKTSIPAYKAHRTRGTYEGRSTSINRYRRKG